jgi:hypothetical protein
MPLSSPRPSDLLPLGTAVEVRDRFCSIWCPGFVVAGSTDTGYLVRRTADQYLLPVPFAADGVRRVL